MRVVFVSLPFNNQYSHHIETSQLICSANQLTDTYFLVCTKGQKEDKSDFVTEAVGVIVTIILM